MNLRYTTLGLTIASAWGLFGCALIGKDDYSTRPIATVKIDSVQEVMKSIQESLYPDGDGKTVFESCSRGFGASAPASGPSSCQTVRNATLASIVAASDDACDQHLKSIYRNEAGWNVALGTLASLFSGTAAVVSANVAKSNYAAAGAFFGAERSLSNEVVYKNQLVPAIHYKILEKRHEKRDALFRHLNEDATVYPLRAGVADAVRYHYTCSFMEGLQWALREGTTNSQEAKLLRARQDLRVAQADYAAASGPTQNAAAERVNALLKYISELELGDAKPVKSPANDPPSASAPASAASR